MVSKKCQICHCSVSARQPSRAAVPLHLSLAGGSRGTYCHIGAQEVGTYREARSTVDWTGFLFSVQVFYLSIIEAHGSTEEGWLCSSDSRGVIHRFPTPLTHLTWPQWTTFYSQQWRGSWRGSPWPWMSSRRSGGGVIRMLIEDDFAKAFKRWLHNCEKCVCIGGGYVDKS